MERAIDAVVLARYGEFRRLAHHYMRSERAGHTLQTAALVHEAYRDSRLSIGCRSANAATSSRWRRP
ncbi:RNA polymerase sigma factor [Luteitalea pratensis]|uniref:RNA polymerase sigma factor n=1 Tax=Luteitalea pratensis TaxID=1855912 RepID=A0A143PLI2_LUTPR|nr:RNA polymerase sigma factor [Luteitalea pratensis]